MIVVPDIWLPAASYAAVFGVHCGVVATVTVSRFPGVAGAPSTTVTVNFSEKVTDFVGTDLVLPAGVTLSNGVLAANGLSFTATLTAGANIADETRAVTVTGGSYHDANGNAGAAFTGPSLEVNTQGPSVTGITQSPWLRLAGKLRARGGQFFFHFVVDFWK